MYDLNYSNGGWAFKIGDPVINKETEERFYIIDKRRENVWDDDLPTRNIYRIEMELDEDIPDDDEMWWEKEEAEEMFYKPVKE